MILPQERKRIWICPECCQFHLSRHVHVARWKSSDQLHGCEGREGYDEFGMCVVCHEAESELGTGWFIENAIVDCETFEGDDEIYYEAEIQV